MAKHDAHQKLFVEAMPGTGQAGISNVYSRLVSTLLAASGYWVTDIGAENAATDFVGAIREDMPQLKSQRFSGRPY